MMMAAVLIPSDSVFRESVRLFFDGLAFPVRIWEDEMK
jgi:hypothetical protein